VRLTGKLTKGVNYDVDDFNGAAYTISKLIFAEIP
jgi:hypothetical protein